MRHGNRVSVYPDAQGSDKMGIDCQVLLVNALAKSDAIGFVSLPNHALIRWTMHRAPMDDECACEKGLRRPSNPPKLKVDDRATRAQVSQ